MLTKIPETNKFYVSNASDLIPNIQYTHNIDMDEEGYLKMSPPFPRLVNDTDVADFDILLDVILIGSVTADTYKAVTNENIYNIDLDALTVTLDASAPTDAADETRFVGWKGGDWYMNTTSDIYSLQTTAGTTWDIENTDGADYMEVFVNRNTLCGASTSSVQQFNEDDMDGSSPPSTHSEPTLDLPNNFEITSLAYSSYRMGVATRNKTGGSAYFFTWDGSTTDAQQGYPVYANGILELCAYKDSWALLTSSGQALYFNGSGFDVLGNLPCFYQNANWILYDTLSHGRTMTTDGDIIYFNIGSQLESSEDDSGIISGFYSGVWCYDPNVGGIYHRYGISHSKLHRESLTPSSGTYTATAHYLESGDKVRYTNTPIYYAIRLTANTFKLADTYDEAIAGTATATPPTGTLRWIKRTDWTQLVSPNINFGACINFPNGGVLVDEGILPFFVGLGLNSKAMAYENSTSVMAPFFDNISTICYYKLKSQQLQDTYESIGVKHSVLKQSDKIIVKYKLKDSYVPIGIGEAGDSTPDVYITWVDSTSFTTTVNLTDTEVGHEVTFVTGAGAGSSAHIVSRTNNAGTWTVVVDESIRGGESGNKSCCIIDAFIKVGTITRSNSLNSTYKEFRVGENSDSMQVKLELRGNRVKIKEMIVKHDTHKEGI